MKNLFETINFQGHPISQSIKRIIAQVEGKSPEQIKKLTYRLLRLKKKQENCVKNRLLILFQGK